MWFSTEVGFPSGALRAEWKVVAVFWHDWTFSLILNAIRFMETGVGITGIHQWFLFPGPALSGVSLLFLVSLWMLLVSFFSQAKPTLPHHRAEHCVIAPHSQSQHHAVHNGKNVFCLFEYPPLVPFPKFWLHLLYQNYRVMDVSPKD